MPPISLYNDKTGEVFEAADEATAEAQRRAYGLTDATPEQISAYDAQKRSGGFVDTLRTVPESAAATLGATVSGVAQAVTGGKVVEEGGWAMTDAAKERRQVNKGAALVGAAIPDVAAGMLIPGAGWGGVVGRAVTTGLFSEGGETAMEGGKLADFSMGDAAMYGVMGGALEAGGKVAIDQAMRAVGATKDALGNAVDRARRWAVGDALEETDAALRAGKLDANYDQLMEKYQTELDDALGQIDQRMADASERMFNPGALRKTVSDNLPAQSEHFSDLSVQLGHAAEVTGAAELRYASEALQEAMAQKGPGMYRAVAAARDLIEAAGDLSDNALAREAFDALDNSLKNEAMWGQAAKNYKTVLGPSVSAGPKSVGAARTLRVNDLKARQSLTDRLDAAQNMARATGDKKLAKQIARARATVSGADETHGARLMGHRQNELRYENTARGRRARVDAAGGGLLGKAKGFLNEIGEDEVGGLVENAFSQGGMALGGAVAGVPGMAAGYLGGRALNKAYGDRVTRFAWKQLKRGARTVARENPGRAAGAALGAVAGLAGMPGAAIPGVGKAAAAAGAYVGQKAGQAAEDVARKVFKKPAPARQNAAERIWEAAKGSAEKRQGMRWTQTAPSESVDDYLSRMRKTPAGETGTQVTARPWTPADGGSVPKVPDPLGDMPYEQMKREAGERARKATAEKGSEAAVTERRAAAVDLDDLRGEARKKAKAEGISEADALAKLRQSAVDFAKENPDKLAGAALLGASTQMDEERAPEGAAAAGVGLLALFLSGKGRKMLELELDEAMGALKRGERAALTGAVERALEKNSDLLREFAAKQTGDLTPDQVMIQQFQNIADEYAKITKKPPLTLDDTPKPLMEAITAHIDHANTALIENDPDLLRLAVVRKFDVLPGSGQKVAGSPDLRRLGLPEPDPAGPKIVERPSIPAGGPSEAQVSQNRRFVVEDAEEALQPGDMRPTLQKRLRELEEELTDKLNANSSETELFSVVDDQLAHFRIKSDLVSGKPPNERELEYARASLTNWGQQEMDRLRRIRGVIARDEERLAKYRQQLDETPTALEGEGDTLLGELAPEKQQLWNGRLQKLAQDLRAEQGKAINELPDEELGFQLGVENIVERLDDLHGLDPREEIFIRKALDDAPPWSYQELDEIIDDGVTRSAQYSDEYDDAEISADDVIRMINSGETRLGNHDLTTWEEYHVRQQFADEQGSYQSRFDDVLGEQRDHYDREYASQEGFESADDYRDARELGFDQSGDYYEARREGLESPEELERWREQNPDAEDADLDADLDDAAPEAPQKPGLRLVKNEPTDDLDLSGYDPDTFKPGAEERLRAAFGKEDKPKLGLKDPRVDPEAKARLRKFEQDHDAQGRKRPGGHRQPGEADGLPPRWAMQNIGVQDVEMHDYDGIANVFGDEPLSLRDMRDLFGLDALQAQAAREGRDLSTFLRVDGVGVRFVGGLPGGAGVNQTFSRTTDGDLLVKFDLTHELPGVGTPGALGKTLKPMLEAIERRGPGIMQTNAEGEGRHIWAALGLKPPDAAERQALQEFAFWNRAPEYTGGKPRPVNVHSLQDIADATHPLSDFDEYELNQLRRLYREAPNPSRVPFEDALIDKTGPDGPQVLTGKAFLLSRPGPWNRGLTIEIAQDNPRYRAMLRRLALFGGAGLIGAGGVGALSENGQLAFREGGGEPQVDPQLVEEARQRAQQQVQVQQTQQQLAYLKQQSQAAIHTTARAVASPAANARTVKRAPGVSQSRGVQAFMGSQSTLRAAFDEKKASLAKRQQDPMILVNELSDSLGNLSDASPDLHRQVVAQTYKVASFLNGKLPSTVGASLTRPEGTPTNPLAIRQFALYYSAATDPSSVLADLTANRAQKEQVDTLRELYPDTYTQLKSAILEQMSQRPPTVPQRMRMDLLFDFGEGLDTALSSRLVAVLEAYKQTPEGQGKGDPNGQGGGAPPAMPTRKSNPSIAATGALSSLSQGAARVA